MEQLVRVKSDEFTTDDFGESDGWYVQYVVFATEDDEGVECFDLYDDDGHGNGVMICRGTSRRRMIALALRLGEFVEWAPGITGKAA